MNTKTKQNRRVVITGLGVVSSLGIGWQEFWKNLIAGKSGISRITSFDTSNYERHYAGEIKNFSSKKFIDERKLHYMGRASQMAITASKLALDDASFNGTISNSNDWAVCIGTTMGEPQVMEKLDNKYFPKGRKVIYDNISSTIYSPNSISVQVAMNLDLHGCNRLYSSACAAGNYTIAQAFDLIRTGRYGFVLAGGADSFSRIAFTGFGRLFVIAPQMCQPFDKNRKGMIPGEGAGIVVLESLESAQRRHAHIYAEVLGCGFSCDAYHMTEPRFGGISKAIEKALISSKVDKENVDYISAHGTGTKENDKVECASLSQVFGKKLSNIPVSSIKSMLGHTMGAASALEAISCCLAIKNGEIPPTINFHERDPECDINCVPNKSIKKKIKIALNNSLAFGGNNACLVLKNINVI